MKIPVGYIILFVAFLCVTFYLIGIRYSRTQRELDNAGIRIKMYGLLRKKDEDSIQWFKSEILLYEQKVAILAHENDSLAAKESVIVYRTVHVPAISYNPSQLDSIWKIRYKIK